MSLATEPMPSDEQKLLVESPRLSSEDTTLDSIADTVGYAAGALEGLRDVLERLNGSVARAREESSAEVRLGQLFTRAHEFLDGVIADARQQAVQILRDADDEAERIVSAGAEEAATLVAAAKEEAERILEEAVQHSGMGGEALRQLESTITTFNRVNAELVSELAALHDALARDVEPEQELVATVDNTSTVPHPETALSADEAVADEPQRYTPEASSPTASLSGSWMHADTPLWERPTIYREPRRRFWRRQP